MSCLYWTVNIWTHRDSHRDRPGNGPWVTAPRTAWTGEGLSWRVGFTPLASLRKAEVCPLQGEAACLGSCGKHVAVLGFEFSSLALSVPAFSPRARDLGRSSPFLRMYQSCPWQGPVNPHGPLLVGQGRLESLLLSRACLLFKMPQPRELGAP